MNFGVKYYKYHSPCLGGANSNEENNKKIHSTCAFDFDGCIGNAYFV